jgi:hypothetical protein
MTQPASSSSKVAQRDSGSRESLATPGVPFHSGRPPGPQAGSGPPTNHGASDTLAQFDERLNRDARAIKAPRVRSFVEFLEQHARVPSSDLRRAGEYDPYTFTGREGLEEPCEVLDTILGGDSGKPLTDATLVLAGGAQFGKTILELYLAAYITSQRFLNVGVYLPDDGLADAIVDTKFRPVVLDNVGWFAEMTQVGRAVNKSGKAVNTKGAFLVTDGERKAVGMFRGLKKVPTSFSLDVVVRDEEDDIARDKAKFLSGRLKQWEAGSQGVMLIAPKLASKRTRPLTGIAIESEVSSWVCPEEHWPQICRLQLGENPSPEDPQLSWEGDFRRNGQPVAEYSPDARFYLAHPETGEELDRNNPVWHHRRPERIRLRHWSFRIAQIGCAAIDLSQIVSHWTRAVADSEEMTSFCCDRLARPKSAAQALTPQILQRSREVAPFDLGARSPTPCPRFAGLDTGDRCWFFLRDKVNAAEKRCARVDQIALGDVVNRVRTLCASNEVDCLFIDERPAVAEARTLAILLNGLEEVSTWPRIDWLSRETYVAMPGGLTWDGRHRRWLNLKCALVRFSKRALGAGIEQTGAEFSEGGQTRFVPLIECNRFETIDRAVREFLTPEQNVIEVVEVDGAKRIRQEPAMRLPRRVPGAPGVLETLDAHLLIGSQRAKEEKTGELGDYVDGCDNHFLLADAYSALSEVVVGAKLNLPKVKLTLI